MRDIKVEGERHLFFGWSSRCPFDLMKKIVELGETLLFSVDVIVALVVFSSETKCLPNLSIFVLSVEIGGVDERLVPTGESR